VGCGQIHMSNFNQLLADMHHEQQIAGEVTKLPVWVELPTGEWVPVQAVRMRNLENEQVLVVYPDLRTSVLG